MEPKCDENTPCSRCVAVSNTAKVFRQPCYREPLDNVIAFRAGNARAGKTRSEPMSPRWAAEDPLVRDVTLFYPFKAGITASKPSLIIRCRKFIPHPWDVLEEPWTVSTGEVITLQSSPFTCVRGSFLLHGIVSPLLIAVGSMICLPV